MKITAIILLTACLQASAIGGKAQTVTLDVKNTSIQKVFNEVSRQTGISIVYNDAIFNGFSQVTIKVKNAPIQEVLDKCLKDQPFAYSFQDNLVVISKKATPTVVFQPTVTPPEPPPPIDVHGRVVNEKGEPIVGASVQVKGDKTKGTSTDADGYFTLKGVDENAILIISGVNIESFEWKVNAKNDLGTISTKTRVIEGKEAIINTGYQKLKPNEVTGSVVQINNELLNRNVSTDILQRLPGIASGLLFPSGTENLVTQRSNIVIRGYSTILSNKEPLIIVDNFPFEGDINSFNPNDVENITILKDAAAAAIWGARAGNGVIVITTKMGKYNQRPKVTFNNNISIIEKPDYFYQKALGSSEYIDVETLLFNNGAYNSQINSSSRPALTPTVEILLKKRTGVITPVQATNQLDSLRKFDVRNDLLKYNNKPIAQQYAVSIAGGGAEQSYFFSAGYDRNTNSTSKYNRISLNATNTHLLIKRKLEITTGIWCSQTRDEFFPSLSGNYPYMQVANADGNPLPVARRRQGYIDTAGKGKLLDWIYYPLKEFNFANNKNTRFSYMINMGIKYKAAKGLEIEVRYRYEKQQAEARNLQSLETYFTRDYINQFTSINWTTGVVTRPVPLGGILDLRNTVFRSQNLRGQFNYSMNWYNRNRITFIGGAEIGDSKTEINSYRYYGYDDEKSTSIPVDFVNSYKGYINGSSSKIINGQSFSSLSARNVSIYANAAYIYKGRYSLSASARKDGSNIFGAATNNKWKPLWSTGASWDIGKEFFYHIKWLPELKLRSSYGYQGNVNNTVVALLTLAYFSPDKWGLPYSAIQNPPNSDLRWEKIGQFNVGLDFGLRNYRIAGTIEYYQKNGKDLIGTNVLPPSSGSPPNNKTNSANIKGHGIDIILNTVNILRKINWSTTFLFSYSRDRVTSYKFSELNISNYIFGSENPIVGNPVSSLYSFRWAGLDPATGDPQGYLNGQISKNYTAILSNSNLNELVYNGPQAPPYFGSILNSVKWKQLSISFNITYKFGYYFRRASINYNSLFSGSDRGNTDYLSRWQKPGDEKFTNVPSLVYPANSGSNTNRDIFYIYSETLVEKGDHIRLQDIRFSYDLSRTKLHKLPFQNLQLYVIASNLAILWKANKTGIDPDYSNLGNQYSPGLPGKRIATGIKIDF